MQRVTVVGDLHGSLADLSRIFELVGWPGPGNTFVFNGDFVDRGDRGVEIIAALFALKVVHPKNIILNRGNHEDTKICKLYGFFDEIVCKYGCRALYEKVCDVFTYLPLGCVIGNEAFVVHAGVPRTMVNIDQINCIPRRKYWIASKHVILLKRWQDLLWSDPVDPSIDQTAKDFEATPNYFRGAGIRYGPGVVREFLKKNKLKTLVRSHQCVGKGWDEIHCGQDVSIWTVFSASNYDGVGNTASVLVFNGDGKGVPRVVTFSAANSVIRCLGFKSRQKLVDLICMNKEALRRELLSVAKKRKDIREGEWSQVLRRVLKLNIDLRHLRGELVGVPSDGSKMVNVESFLERYKMQVILPDGICFSLPEEDALAQYLLPKAHEVASVFYLLDKNLDGKLTLEEANAGLQLAKKKLASSYMWQGNFEMNAHEIFESCFAAGSAFLEVVQFCRGWCQVFLQPDLNYQL
ncbi:hypothetical protein GUITHDRAFT_86901 [Guillardia theta CCMP2712]|uniref:Serine/threonine-protein phosphatase n=1 Tax=Guillardia theta (strain CCMP2712) TaxID=905079 RepID=L1JB71_GUITC|nr:hypothetical protein GUITHDRAFT_86901 [Guillardia theta CCMP2712]EKX45768.1 hypothetical protein GUITHDRAFT_86901 [Guillardia theta CCMP2712]|eukprot:XP_005832748.1 hypothetical protein GUITHDRAFT_86901 [Guillardia theta CCMP2712]